MVSIHLSNLGGLGRSSDDPPASLEISPVSSPVHDSITINTKSWGDSLLELNSDLQKICNSPITPPGSYLRNALSQTFDVSLSPRDSLSLPPEEIRCSSLGRHHRRTSSHESKLREVASLSARRSQSPQTMTPDYLRSNSYACGQKEELPARPFIVRHQQTSEKLAEKLSRICGPGKGQVSDFPKSSPSPKIIKANEYMTTISAAPRRQSLTGLKSAFSHIIEIPGIQLPDIAVSMSENKCNVLHFSSKDFNVIAEVDMPSSINITHLLCKMEEGKLVIREISKPLWCCKADSEIGEHYLPVIMQDDTTHHLTVILHIPEQLSYEDLSVRTIDDHLIIADRRKIYPGASNNVYKMVLILPDMGHSRGVDASLTHSNQLCVIVTFDA